jgi:hypothetical protein
MCQVQILSVNGIVPPGSSNPTQLRETGRLSQCPSGQVVVTSNFTAPSPPTSPSYGPNADGFIVVLAMVLGLIALGGWNPQWLVCLAVSWIQSAIWGMLLSVLYGVAVEVGCLIKNPSGGAPPPPSSSSSGLGSSGGTRSRGRDLLGYSAGDFPAGGLRRASATAPALTPSEQPASGRGEPKVFVRLPGFATRSPIGRHRQEGHRNCRNPCVRKMPRARSSA